MRKAFLVVAFAMIFAFSMVAFAQQPTTGILQGVVGEQDGKPLPGATVVVKGPLGERAVTSDAQGMFEFRFLPPGLYSVRVQMTGYSTLELNKVDISAGQRTRLPVTLLPGKTEEITVTSTTPIMDVKKTEVTTAFKTDTAIQTMPIGRNFVAAVAFAPGVVSGGGTGGGNYSIGGSSGLENSYIIDGVNITDSGYGGVGTYSLSYGSLGTGITSDFLEEVQVKTAGFEAEYGQALGGVISGTVRSGTNAFKGRVGVYVEPRALTSYGKDVTLPSGSANVHDPQSVDVGIQASGPFWKDHAFWFAAYNPVKTWNDLYQTIPDPYIAVAHPGSAHYNENAAATYPSDVAFPSAFAGGIRGDRRRDNYAVKFNWVITPNHRLELIGFGDPSKGYGGRGTAASSAYNLEDGQTHEFTKVAAGFAEGGLQSEIKYGAHQQSLKYNGLFGTDWFLEAQVNHRSNKFEETSTVNDFNYRDVRMLLAGESAITPRGGGIGFIGPTNDKSWDFGVKLSKTFGPVELKAGVQWYDLRYQATTKYSGPNFTAFFPKYGAVLSDPSTFVQVQSTSGGLVQVRGNMLGVYSGLGTTNYRVTRARFNEPGETKAREIAGFIQANWTITDRVTVKLGLRSSSQKLEGASPFDLALSPDPEHAGRYLDTPQHYAPNKYTFKTEVSPRFGLTVDPFADGKTKLYLTAARYFERVPSDLAVRQFSNEVGISRMSFYDPQLSKIQSTTVSQQGVSPGTVQHNTKLPFEDEVVLGWQQVLRPDVSVEIRGIYRRQGRALEDVQFTTVEDIENGYYDGASVLDGDGTSHDIGKPFPNYGYGTFGNYVLANPGQNTGTNFGKPERVYKALEITLEKRLADNWQGFLNYRYSRLRGNYEGLFRNDNGQSDPNITSLFDFPNSEIMRGQFNAGPLNNDRPHVLHAGATYFWNNGLEFGGIINWQSGIPRTAMLAHPNYANAGELPGADPRYRVWDSDAHEWSLTNVGQSCATYYSQFTNIDTAGGAAFEPCFLGAYTDAPRGNGGRTPELATLDLHLGYRIAFKGMAFKAALDVINLFSNQEPTGFDDNVETTAATPNPTYGKILGYQSPRSMRISLVWDW